MAKTIAAVATGNAAGGIGVIRISGDKAIEIASKVFAPCDNSSLTQLAGYRAKYGNIICNGEAADNAVALVFRAPKSYTGEDVVELSVHGGLYIVQKTLEAVFEAGAEPAEAGEFTKRAFLNGKMDLTQAESVADFISAQGDAAAKASFNLLQGALSKRISTVLESLVDSSALMAAWVDYPDEEIPELESETLEKTLEEAQKSLGTLIKNYENGQTITQGVDTAIVGKPNAGKSTLMNLLVGRDKSIVTDIAGTTRDVVEDSVRLGNLVLHLSDTAGIRESDDVVEAIGIRRAKEKIDSAALVIAVFDSSTPLDENDRQIIEKCKGKKAVAVINKIDLDETVTMPEIENAFNKTVYISAKNDSSLDTLENAVSELLGVSEFDSSAPILANIRQKNCCKAALFSIEEALFALQSGLTYDAVNVMIDSAVDSLLELTGKKATVEVVNNIFSKFCVGK
uniref:tRNA uridine-5-carboxymethylaminomethyl(34) synthesis GTPase MnmE n=1 Tax=Eubacterium sp. TaxID=142586 RepID=UPI0040264010